jgi:imidazolonepropionase-like amidohydrolase
MSSYVAHMHETGVQLAIGTDSANPGAAVLSEMLLLHRTGIPMNEVLKIATYGSARVLVLTGRYGSIEPGKKAHFVIFDQSPLEDPEALLGGKTVIKDGVVWEGP